MFVSSWRLIRLVRRTLPVRNMKGAMVYLIIFVLFLSMKWVNPAETAGEEYLDVQEAQVTRLQLQVQNIQLRQCELLASCAAPANCSRRSCWPLVGDVQRTTCQIVQNNSYCATPATGACISRKNDFTRPYVRLAATTDMSATETATSICAQRELSIVFKDICNSTSPIRPFFGTVDGTYWQFPGSDQSDENCETYDPRLRPWYCNSASVTKAMMVLLDVGESMGNSVPAPLRGTFFTIAQSIVLELLNTLSAQDYVNIITFDSTKATSLASSPVKVLLDEAGNSASPEFDGLKANLANLTTLNLENLQRPSNISLGIAEALRNYAPGYPSAMQIIIAFTDGDAQNLKDGALAALQGRNGTKVFIFKLPQISDANQFLAGTPFLTQLRNMGGSFSVITTEASNPLYSILPYFSFLASFRAKINSSADYSSVYEDFEHAVKNKFSITKPAFDPDGNLLGVVGLNILVDELGSLTDLVYQALQTRITSKTFDPTTVAFTAADARIQVSSPGLPCPSIQTPTNMGLCTRTDTTSTIQTRSCCNACSTHTHAHSTPKYIAIGVCVGAFAIAAFIFVLFYCGIFPCCRKQPKRYDFSGDDEPAKQTSQEN